MLRYVSLPLHLVTMGCFTGIMLVLSMSIFYTFSFEALFDKHKNSIVIKVAIER